MCPLIKKISRPSIAGHTPLIPASGEQKHMNYYTFSLFSIVNSKADRVTERQIERLTETEIETETETERASSILEKAVHSCREIHGIDDNEDPVMDIRSSRQEASDL